MNKFIDKIIEDSEGDLTSIYKNHIESSGWGIMGISQIVGFIVNHFPDFQDGEVEPFDLTILGTRTEEYDRKSLVVRIHPSKKQVIHKNEGKVKCVVTSDNGVREIYWCNSVKIIQDDSFGYSPFRSRSDSQFRSQADLPDDCYNSFCFFTNE